MANKQFKTHCRIVDYVEVADPDLFALIKGLCTEGALTSLKGKPGITFLMPQDKTFRATLEKLAYSDKTEDATRAGDMLNACIMRDVFKTPADWKSREVSNALYPSQIVEVESTNAKEVIFKSGAKAVLDTDFKDASRKSNLAVWKLVSGEIPVTTDKPANMMRKKTGGKTGGYDPGNVQSAGERFKIALAVENAYVVSRASPSQRDVYCEYTLSLVNYILHVRNDSALFYEKVLPMISLDKIDFYLLVEPHRTSGQYLLDDNLIHEWWSQRNKLQIDMNGIRKEIEQMLNPGSGAGTNALIYTQRSTILDRIDEVRKGLSQATDARPRSCVDMISKVYDDMIQTNSIGGLSPVYPAGLIQYYQAESGLKLVHDELRYLTFGAFRRLESRPFDYGAFHELTNMIGECLHASTQDERGQTQKLLNKNSIKYLISPKDKLQEIRIFLYSTMFMYIPMTEADSTNLGVKNSITRPNPDNIVVFNICKNLYTQHKRILSGNADDSLISAMMSLDVSNLDAGLRDQLKKKFGVA